MSERVYLYDSTLRDGAQTQGVDFGVADKLAIAAELDRLGIDYIEGGWPGANPTDDTFFAQPPKFSHARLVAFGMTRKAGASASNDPSLRLLLNSGADAVCVVGKASDYQARVALGIELEENIALIADTVRIAAEHLPEVLFDAEHFFDGYKENPEFSLRCLTAAYEAGARWIVLCDTNGGTLPHEIGRIVAEVAKTVPGEFLGIHCHNDADTAVAGSLAAVRAGVRQVQGTFNGLGERCGNANLVSILPTLMLKMGFKTGVESANLKQLVHVSRMIDERLNRSPVHAAAYVGESAFTHKGGLHVSGVEKDPHTYEHIEPEAVGNSRHIVVSDQSGRSNIFSRIREIGLKVEPGDPKVVRLLELVKEREHEGYAYDGAEASFELLARRLLDGEDDTEDDGKSGGVPDYFRLNSFRVFDERRWNARGELITLSEATLKLEVKGQSIMTVSEGNGPVNALDNALRKSLAPSFPVLEGVRLVDYKVRILNSNAGTEAVTRVMIESVDAEGARWATVGVSANLIDASYRALHDSITYKLFCSGATP
jgi:2-isopropylmalate synthase